MARSITTFTASVINRLLTGELCPTELKTTQAVRLTQLGCLDIDNRSRLIITPNAERVLKRYRKNKNQLTCDLKVEKALTEILKEDGAVTQHRQVWVAVGQTECTRAEVLTSLQKLRDSGYLKSFRRSGNNFQVFWALKEDEPEAPEFGSLADSEPVPIEESGWGAADLTQVMDFEPDPEPGR